MAKVQLSVALDVTILELAVIQDSCCDTLLLEIPPVLLGIP